MEITDVEPIVLDSAVDSTALPGQAGDRPIEISSVVVRVETDAGITGLGESFYRSVDDNEFLARSVEKLSRNLVGKDPRNVTHNWHDLYMLVKRNGAYGALSALDQAMWDIKGKDAGKPVYQLLGGRTKDVKAYATFPVAKEADELAEDSKWLAEKGFQAMKVGAGYGVEEDRDRIRTITAETPDGFGLAIDANTSYDFPDALDVAETASEHGLEWFEEPIAHTDIEGLAELNGRVSVPISAYQTHTPHYPAVDHLRTNALEIYQPTLTWAGGITGANRVATLVEAFDKRLVPHALGPAVNYAASLHVAAAARACTLIEFAVLDDTLDDPGQYISGPYVENRDAIYVRDGGDIPPPEDPGLGIRLDEDVLEEMRVN